MKPKQPVRITYKNWKGVTSVRNIWPDELIFGTSEYHKDEQWLLEAFDIDKHDYRLFAMKDISSWEEANDS